MCNVEHRMKGLQDVTLKKVFRPRKPNAMKNSRKLHNEALCGFYFLTGLISLMNSRRMELADWTNAQFHS
jgi:hypothetical protein